METLLAVSEDAGEAAELGVLLVEEGTLLDAEAAILEEDVPELEDRTPTELEEE